jgi:hypothetical protein
MSAILGSLLIVWVWAVITVGVPDSPRVWTVAIEGASEVGRGIGHSIDAVAGIVVTVLLGFYIAIIGGQFTPGIDIVSLRRKLSSAALILAVLFVCLSALTITWETRDGSSFGEIVVVVIEVVITTGLAIELTSWVLLSRALQVEQNLIALERSRARLRSLGAGMRGSARRGWSLTVLIPVLVPAVPSVVLSLLGNDRSMSLVLALVLATVMSQGSFGLVFWSRLTGLPGIVRWTTPAVVAFVGFWALITTLYLAVTDHGLQAVATLLAFVVPLMLNLASDIGRSAIPLTLKPLIARIEYVDAVLARRASLQRLERLTAPDHDRNDDEDQQLLDWLQRTSHAR